MPNNVCCFVTAAAITMCSRNSVLPLMPVGKQEPPSLPSEHQRSPNYSSRWLSPSRPTWLNKVFSKSLAGRHRSPGDSIWLTELCFQTPQSQNCETVMAEFKLGPSVQLQSQGEVKSRGRSGTSQGP